MNHFQPTNTTRLSFDLLRMSGFRATLTALVFILMLMQAPFSFAQDYIKCWKNNEGLTECGNRIPREHYSKKVRFIDTQGITRKVKERDKTAEELAIEEENQRILEAELAHKKKLKKYDDILLKTYLTVDDLLSALNSKLGSLESRITVLESILESRKKHFDELVKKAADIERSGKAIPVKLSNRLNAARLELRNLESQIDSEQQEALKIQKTYAHDVERFMITSANRMHYGLAQPEIARKSNAVRLFCSSEKQCAEYWNKANDYVKQYSSTPVRYASNKIVVTDSPAKSHDIAMGLTYLDQQELKENKNHKYIIFQLRCQQGKAGQEYCKDDNISNILREFKSEMYY